MALTIGDLTVSYRQQGRWLDVVREVSLSIQPGQTYGLVGESGSGKTTLALAVMRYLGEHGRIRQGTIELAGLNLLTLDEASLVRARRDLIRLVPQNPQSSLNPSMRIGEQVAETLPGLSESEGKRRVLALLSSVRLPDPERVMQSYPHQLSGGMLQRVMIAMALSGEPALLILDEPTTNLDATTEAAILDLIRELIRARRTAVLYVSHSLSLISQLCERVAVLYAGELVEDAPVGELFQRPLHPYTQGLLDSVPRIGQNKRAAELRPIPGQIPRAGERPPGCVFAPRCHLANALCEQARPPLDTPGEGRRVRCHRWPEIAAGAVGANQIVERYGFRVHAPTRQRTTHSAPPVVLAVTHLQKRFPVRRTLGEWLNARPPRQIEAVRGVDLEISRGRTLGLVGESGSGKTTVARCIIGLSERSGGEVALLDIPLAPSIAQRAPDLLRRLQMVLQNPDEALNPYLNVGEILGRPLQKLAGYAPADAARGVSRLLEAVKLDPATAARLPGQLSGGEKQRVAIARAFATRPDLILFDEPVSALDMSVQAAILNLIAELQRESRHSVLLISHDLAVVGYLADEVIVMYLGRAMEVARTEDIFTPPHHPYTEALLSAIPVMPRPGESPLTRAQPIHLDGDIPSPMDAPAGCPFHTRCPRSLGEICARQEPPWQVGQNGRRVFCHIPLDDLEKAQRTNSDREPRVDF